MRRIGRYIFKVLAILSLALFVATIGLWVRSYWVADGFERYTSRYAEGEGDRVFIDNEWCLGSTRGGLSYFHARSNRYFMAEHRPFERWRRACVPAHDFVLARSDVRPVQSPRAAEKLRELAGIVVLLDVPERIVISGDPFASIVRRINVVWVPYRLAAVAFALIPIVSLSVMVRSRRAAVRQLGCCRKCGYNLCATPNRCPECGTVPKGR